MKSVLAFIGALALLAFVWGAGVMTGGIQVLKDPETRQAFERYLDKASPEWRRAGGAAEKVFAVLREEFQAQCGRDLGRSRVGSEAILSRLAEALDAEFTEAELRAVLAERLGDVREGQRRLSAAISAAVAKAKKDLADAEQRLTASR